MTGVSDVGSGMKESPGTSSVPGEKKHRHRAVRGEQLPSGVEEVRGGGTWNRDEHPSRVGGFDQVFRLSALSSSDERLCQFEG